MSQAQQAAAECMVGRSFPDMLNRRGGERRKALDTKVDIDPTSAWLGEMERREGERRRFAAQPECHSALGDLA